MKGQHLLMNFSRTINILLLAGDMIQCQYLAYKIFVQTMHSKLAALA